METLQDLGLKLKTCIAGHAGDSRSRFQAEFEFGCELAAARPDDRCRWEQLLAEAGALVLEANDSEVASAVARAEDLLSPLSATAKQYTVHCVGHAHIDMNWMWGWHETVAVVHDTFTTVDSLMSEFPHFRFSQSQASIYAILRDYLPELREKVERRIADGRWEVTASQWVEGDKNLASGEALCRHLLYTRRFLQEEYGIPHEAVLIDFEPDTFGHAHTVPTILANAGVKRYYFCRGGHGPRLFWWQGKDGSRVLAFDDQAAWYNGTITPDLTRGLLSFEAETGLKDMLFLYGVGDHGGGPTRRDLNAAGDMDSWPIFPHVKLSKLDDFFATAERDARDLPVVDGELNFVFEGCYTSQSRIKAGNRASENALVEAEAFAVIAERAAELSYPRRGLTEAWRHALLNHFHDILPGSGVAATSEYALGGYQQVLARTTATKTRALRALVERIDTSACRPNGRQAHTSIDVGGGAGDVPSNGALSRYAGGKGWGNRLVVFNPSPWERSEVITLRLWDTDLAEDTIAVMDETGVSLPVQVIGSDTYWGHNYLEVAFPARDVPGLGYRSYSVTSDPSPSPTEGCRRDGEAVLENEFLRVEIDPKSGAVSSLVDKRTGAEFVPPGQLLGCLEYVLEAPHGMTAWVLGEPVETKLLSSGAVLDPVHRGPWLASVRSRHQLNETELSVTVSLSADSRRVDFEVEANWLERGSPEVGVPALRAVFPLAIAEGVARFECPNGHVARPTDPTRLATYTHKWVGSAGSAATPGEVPAQKWADLTGRQDGTDEPVGAALLNMSRYGHSVSGSTIRLSLLRSSYDPDPLPELGKHVIKFALEPHVGDWSVSQATRSGYAINLPLQVIATDEHEGGLPPSKGFLHVQSPNVMLSGLKKAEEGDAIVLRLYEMEGKQTQARVVLDPALAGDNPNVIETDLLECPLARNTARYEEDALTVDIRPFGLTTVMIAPGMT
jgi:alpha-mannosidase